MKKEISIEFEQEMSYWPVGERFLKNIREELIIAYANLLDYTGTQVSRSNTERKIFSMAERFCFLKNVSGLNIVVNHFIDSDTFFS